MIITEFIEMASLTLHVVNYKPVSLSSRIRRKDTRLKCIKSPLLN